MRRYNACRGMIDSYPFIPRTFSWAVQLCLFLIRRFVCGFAFVMMPHTYVQIRTHAVAYSRAETRAIWAKSAIKAFVQCASHFTLISHLGKFPLHLVDRDARLITLSKNEIKHLLESRDQVVIRLHAAAATCIVGAINENTPERSC